MKVTDKYTAKQRRHLRLRQRVVGTAQRPRLSVHRSLQNMYVQLIDDIKGHSLLACSTLTEDFKQKYPKEKNNKKAAAALGEMVAERALAKGIDKVIFDRSGYKYHGRIKMLADAARGKGLKF